VSNYDFTAMPECVLAGQSHPGFGDLEGEVEMLAPPAGRTSSLASSSTPSTFRGGQESQSDPLVEGPRLDPAPLGEEVVEQICHPDSAGRGRLVLLGAYKRHTCVLFPRGQLLA
jgi:hypothetical protein